MKGPIERVAAVAGSVSSLDLSAASGALLMRWTSPSPGDEGVAVSADADRSWRPPQNGWLSSDPEPADDAGWSIADRPDAERVEVAPANAAQADAEREVIERPSPGMQMAWAGLDPIGDLVTVWRGPTPGRLSMHRYPIASLGHPELLPSIPITVTTTAADESPVSVLPTPGGAIVAWVTADDGGPHVVARELGFDSLCGLVPNF